MKTFLRKGVYLVVIVLSAVACIVALAIVLVPMYGTYRDVTSYHNRTSPLAEDTVKDLCSKLNLLISDPRCSANRSVYAPEFFDDIIMRLKPADGRVVTINEVEELLGEYEYKREPNATFSDGSEYYVVYYDLQGDRVFPIVVGFFADGRLWRMSATTVRD